MITLEKLKKGSMARDLTDPKTPRVGIVMDVRGERVHLRPPGGGVEWSRPLTDVEPYTLSSALSPQIAQINNRASHPTR